MLYSYCLISPYTGNLYALYIKIRNANSLKSMHLKLDGRDLLLKLSSHCSTKRKKPCLGNDRKVRTRYKSSESSLLLASHLSAVLRSQIWATSAAGREARCPCGKARASFSCARRRLTRQVGRLPVPVAARSSCVLAPLDREHSGDVCAVFSMCIRVPDE